MPDQDFPTQPATPAGDGKSPGDGSTLPRLEPGDNIGPYKLLHRLGERVRTDLTGQPATRAVMMRTMGRVYTELDLFEEAGRLVREALTLPFELVGNTIAGNDLHGVACLTPVDLHVTRTIIAFNGQGALGGDCATAAVLACTDLYGNQAGDFTETRRMALIK